MYDAWISAMQKGIGAAFHRYNTDQSLYNNDDNSKQCDNTNEANGSVSNKVEKVKKVR